MKALAASSIGQYERAVAALADYELTVERGLAACLRLEAAEAITAGSAAGSVGAVVFGSDQGLIGRFNEVTNAFVVGELGRERTGVSHIWVVGERIHALMAEAHLAVPVLLPVPRSVTAIAPLVGRLLVAIEAARERGGVRTVYVFHNRSQTAGSYEPVKAQLLPLDLTWRRQLCARPWPSRTVPQVIEGVRPVLEGFVREYLFTQLYQACAQSLACENASRLAAMQRADRNIEQALETLNQTFRRVRQESIDEELFEVMAGYESLLSAVARI